MSAYSLILFTGKLTGRLKIDTEVRIVALVIFANVFYGVDMEGHRESVHGQDDRLGFAIDDYLGFFPQ